MMMMMMIIIIMMKTQNSHNSDNFEVTNSKFCMLLDTYRTMTMMIKTQNDYNSANFEVFSIFGMVIDRNDTYRMMMMTMIYWS